MIKNGFKLLKKSAGPEELLTEATGENDLNIVLKHSRASINQVTDVLNVAWVDFAEKGELKTRFNEQNFLSLRKNFGKHLKVEINGSTLISKTLKLLTGQFQAITGTKADNIKYGIAVPAPTEQIITTKPTMVRHFVMENEHSDGSATLEEITDAFGKGQTILPTFRYIGKGDTVFYRKGQNIHLPPSAGDSLSSQRQIVTLYCTIEND